MFHKELIQYLTITLLSVKFDLVASDQCVISGGNLGYQNDDNEEKDFFFIWL